MLSWLVLAAVAVAATAAAAGDQYAQQAARVHRFNVPQEELQVGCADGELHHKHEGGPILQVLKRLKRQAEQLRQKRDYIQWYGSTTTYQQQPNYIQTYQIHSTVPYFVPVWGNPRRIPIFFPAKPILFNPGYPARNPPAVTPTTTEAPSSTDDGSTDLPVSIGTRGGAGFDMNEAGEPIWGIVDTQAPASPSNSVGSAGGSSRPPPSASRPTRPPTPPLIHRPSRTEENSQPTGISDRDNPNVGQGSNIQEFRPPVTQFRPQTTPRTTTTPPAAAAPSGREEPNRCVWAIISCCNPANNQVSYSCFERLGCPGQFWDTSPCSREVTAAAFNAAAKFYEQT